jgi:F-type H+-transporting ATPase subunit delta
MFHENRWAAVFVNSLGKNAEAGLICLKTLVQPIKAVSGTMFGYFISKKLEKMLRESGGDAISGDIALEYGIRFITLVVEKSQFKNIDVILHKIEERIDEQNKVLVVTVESAASLDNTFEDELKHNIVKLTGATDIKMKTQLVPDLLSGYRLRIGDFFIDASLKGQMEEMKTALTGGM